MIGGSALASRALSDAGRRDMASEWGGPAPVAAQSNIPIAPETVRRLTVRKP